MPQLPEAPSLEWLRKQAKRKLADLQRDNPAARLADAQLALAREYGFPSWRAMKAHIESLTLPGQLFQAARAGEVVRVATILDEHPHLLDVREPPYKWTLLHAAAQMGQLGVVDLLISRGFDVNTKEQGDDTTALHWAAAAGKVDVVKRLLDAGIDPVGAGDDHGLTAIGWASAWKGTDTPAHKEVVRLLLAAGARHTIFSAIGASDADAVRALVREDPAVLEQQMTKNEGHRRPLHFAVDNDHAGMVRLLLELGADPDSTDDAGMQPVVYSSQPGVSIDTIRALKDGGAHVDDIYLALVAGDFGGATAALRREPYLLNAGVLHMMARRNDTEAVRWLLQHGADPSARWSHFGAVLTAMHIATTTGNIEMLKLLLDAGGDPSIKDTMFDSDVAGWANHHRQTAMESLLANWKR